MDTLEKVQGTHSNWTMSMVSVDISPLSPWTMSMDLVESLDKVHGYSGESPGSPLKLDNVHGLSGHFSTVSLDNVHGLSGKSVDISPLSPCTMSMDLVESLDNVHGYSGEMMI